MVAKDDIDVETLQAQVDMSMSFAHDLVASWIKPTHLAQLRSNSVSATQIFEEELRRPPRLGVGASIPIAPPLAHETSKLRRRLGKHRARNKGAVESQLPDSFKSDDEEHKGRPTKRKTKADPFEHDVSKKRRKVESKTNPDSSIENVSKHPVSLLKKPAFRELSKHRSSSSKEKKRGGPVDQHFHMPEQEQFATSVSPPPMRLPAQTTFSPSVTVPTTPSLSGPSRETSEVPVPGKSTTLQSSRAHVDFVSIPDKAKPLGIPLLNLDGPPGLTDHPGNTSELHNSTKKRKRRKKKKKQLVAGTGDD